MKWTKNIRSVEVSLKDIHPNPKNPRKGTYEKADLEELKENMTKLEQLVPLKIDENGTLLAGHRRYTVAKELGWDTIRCEVRVGLSEFEKSAIMIADNTTQKQFNAWENRQAISDIYWNEFCEEYEFKSNADKGYAEFAKRLGLSQTTVRKIIESMQTKNMDIARKLKEKNIGIEAFDIILGTPKKYREQVLKKVMDLTNGKDGKNIRTDGMREHLRMFKKQLVAKEAATNMHPSFFHSIHHKISALGLGLTKDVIRKADINEQIKLKEAIETHIIPYYNLLVVEIQKNEEEMKQNENKS